MPDLPANGDDGTAWPGICRIRNRIDVDEAFGLEHDVAVVPDDRVDVAVGGPDNGLAAQAVFLPVVREAMLV